MYFSEYFDEWLYGQKDGYYTHYKDIGKKGDFFTAVSTSSYFGGSIGKKIVDLIEKNELKKDATILEIGAHHGYLLSDIIQFIYTLKPELLDTLTFAIVERKEDLRVQQLEYFKQCFGDVIKLKQYKDIDEVHLEDAMIVANEIFDAFKCELVYTNKDENLQIGKVDNHNVKFEDEASQSIVKHCEKYKITKGEISVGFEQFAQTLSKNIDNFHFITFDYGDLYPRNDFSIRIYQEHKVYPLFDEDIKLEELYAKSDITCDVHFGYLIDCFEEAGVKKIAYKTQLQALVDFGIIDLLEILHKNAEEKYYMSEVNKVKVLLEPTGMGDRFKMVHFRKIKGQK